MPKSTAKPHTSESVHRRPNNAADKKKKTVASSSVMASPGVLSGRRLKLTRPKGIRRLSPVRPKFVPRPATLPAAWRIGQTALGILRANWGLFLGITLIYTVLNILLVRGLSGSADVAGIKEILDGGFGRLASGLGAFVILVTSSGNSSNPVAGVYQTLLAVIASLAIVWSLRQVLAGSNALRIRDAFYGGMYPLVPVVLVLITMGLQLLPVVLGAGLYALVASNGIASTPLEHAVWAILAFLLAAVSFYLLISSVFALYIATLPEMTPMKALRSARELVRYRRWSVLRKLIFLPFVLLLISLAIMLPIIIFVTPLSPWVLFLLTMAGLPVIHAYMYTLYRELLV